MRKELRGSARLALRRSCVSLMSRGLVSMCACVCVCGCAPFGVCVCLCVSVVVAHYI